MPNLPEQISDFAKGVFVGGSSVIAIILFFVWLWVKYPNNVKIVLSQIWYILSFIFKKWAGRQYVKTHLEGTLGKAIKKINKEVYGLEADDIRIVLVKTKTREAILKERTLIIRLQRKENHAENLVNVAMVYTDNFLYSKLELHLDDEQKESIKLYTTKSLLKERGNAALQIFHKNYYLPAAKNNKKTPIYFEKLERIDVKGLFFNVFVQEMVFLGNKVYFRRKPENINEEIEKFVDFLERFAQRERGEEDIERTFIGTNIKAAFILVALKEKRELGLSDNYIYYIEETLLPQGIESFYVLGWGHNIPFTHRVANTIKEKLNNLAEIHRITYKSKFSDDEFVDALSVLFRNKNIAELQDYIPITEEMGEQKNGEGKS